MHLILKAVTGVTEIWRFSQESSRYELVLLAQRKALGYVDDRQSTHVQQGRDLIDLVMRKG